MTTTLDMPVGTSEQIAEAPRPDPPSPNRKPKAGPSPRSERLGQALVLTILLAVPALMAVRAACVWDPDIWWHLRTGEWIAAHSTVPRNDTYTSFAVGKPWQAYSWLFELIVYKLFARLGLTGIVVYTAAMLLAITVALHHMIRRLQRDFSIGILLTFAGCYAMSHLYTPRPWHFTILFFILELNILMHARRTGRVRELAWLPVIFALWANLHIQFIDGLFVLGIALGESIADRWLPSAKTKLAVLPIAVATAGCLAATLLNPYGWRLYKIAHDLATQPGVLGKISELQAIAFRDPADTCILLLALMSAAMLARAKQLPIFETALFAFAAYVSFRSQRDVWVLAIVACAILASQITGSEKARIRVPVTWTAPIALVAMLATGIGFRAMHVNNQRLAGDLIKEMPVSAVDFVRAKHYPGPVFNDFTWGGYLIWSLRLPVTIDGRAALIGDERMDSVGAAWAAEPNWSDNRDLNAAGVIIGRSKAALTQVLRTDPRFTLVYEDKLAAVFVPKASGPGKL